MHALGIIQLPNSFQWALAYRGKTIQILRMEESSSIPDDVLSIKKLKIITGLEGSSVIRRDLKLPLTTFRTIKEALPFQLEPLLPFPLNECVVFPEVHLSGKESFIVAWAALKSSAKAHVEKWNKLGIDPDIVSSETLALARWAAHFHPDENQIVAVYETVGIALEGPHVVCAMESPDPARLKLFLKHKYPLFTWVKPETPFALAIGLALEAFQKNGCQFRSKDLPSQRQKTREKSILKKLFSAGAALMLLAVVISSVILYSRESILKKDIARFYNLPEASLELSISRFREKIMKEKKTAPAVLDFPSNQEVLSWLSALSAPVEIAHFEYELISAHKAMVSIEFQAAGSNEADQFAKQLQQSPTFVDPTRELKWTSHPQGYKLSFELRKKS